MQILENSSTYRCLRRSASDALTAWPAFKCWLGAGLVFCPPLLILAFLLFYKIPSKQNG